MKVSQLQELLKTIPPETDIFISDTGTDWVLDVETITKGKKAVYIRGSYSLQTSEEINDDFFGSRDYLYRKRGIFAENGKIVNEKE